MHFYIEVESNKSGTLKYVAEDFISMIRLATMIRNKNYTKIKIFNPEGLDVTTTMLPGFVWGDKKPKKVK